MTHKAIRVDNLMYNGCEAHWKCTVCGLCVPFHCYSKSQFESQECLGKELYSHLTGRLEEEEENE